MDEHKVAGHCPLCGELAYKRSCWVECEFCGWKGESCGAARIVIQSVS